MVSLRIRNLFSSWPIVILAISGGLLPGCSTALSTLQTAETVPKGHWQATGGMDVAIPVTRVIDAVDAAIDLEEKLRDDPGYEPTEAELQDYADAAIGLALSPPGTGIDLMLRRGFTDQLDVGVRYTTTGLHADAKFMFLRPTAPDGWTGSLSLGYAYHNFDGFIFDVLELLRIDDFSRHDLEVPIIFGKKLRYGHYWLGPKLVVAFVSIDAKLEYADETLQTDDTIYYYGGFAGASFGYRGVEVFAELTVMEMLAEPTIFGRKRDLGGTIVMPSAGLMARF
jgi:hypothetical protein